LIRARNAIDFQLKENQFMTTQAEAFAAAPPVTVVSISAFGVSLPDIAWIMTIAYTGVLLTHKLWKIYGEWESRKLGKPRRRADDVEPE
jgi:hypothetical protein